LLFFSLVAFLLYRLDFTRPPSLPTMAQRRTVFFVSDGTGITAEMLGHSLLTQFEGVQFSQVTLPFVDSVARAEECLDQIEREAVRDNSQPIVFATLVNVELRAVIRARERAGVRFLRGRSSIRSRRDSACPRRTPSAARTARSTSRRITGAWRRSISRWRTTTALRTPTSRSADVILVGVSRSGKTPTCLTSRCSSA
jgi:hypothetical protein